MLDDYLRAQLGSTLDALSFEALPAAIRFREGRPAQLQVRVVSTERRPIGELPLEIRDAEGQTVAAIATESSGLFAGVPSASAHRNPELARARSSFLR